MLWRAFRVCLSCLESFSQGHRLAARSNVTKLNLRFVHQRSRPSVCCYDRLRRILTLFTLLYFPLLYFARSLASDLR